MPISTNEVPSSSIWKFLNQILLSRRAKLKTWSKNGWLLGWFFGVPRVFIIKFDTIGKFEYKKNNNNQWTLIKGWINANSKGCMDYKIYTQKQSPLKQNPNSWESDSLEEIFKSDGNSLWVIFT